jgi:L-lactate permease
MIQGLTLGLQFSSATSFGWAVAVAAAILTRIPFRSFSAWRTLQYY